MIELYLNRLDLDCRHHSWYVKNIEIPHGYSHSSIDPDGSKNTYREFVDSAEW